MRQRQQETRRCLNGRIQLRVQEARLFSGEIYKACSEYPASGYVLFRKIDQGQGGSYLVIFGNISQAFKNLRVIRALCMYKTFVVSNNIILAIFL